MLRESYRWGFIANPVAPAARLRSLRFRTSRALTRRFEEQIHELESHQAQRNSESQPWIRHSLCAMDMGLIWD
jgi:hypothetical protein